ncbi:PREDICTED: cyclic phosphodiesterase-like [Fragaria vesca subsp. vesca]|uniref:cyclic phosphodiesterase-like n=1 Tax=Fragaria vesca subsp. vesca TaxID=101020 RepID=UPI0002C3744B|nr:PREDICTED: cyclic phosphodiesterase-like [Fragaria vesca subsp. vesca]
MANVDPATAGNQDAVKTPHRYAAWGLLSDPVSRRIKNVTEGLRAEFGGPEIMVPHIPILGSIIMTEEDAVNTFRLACDAVGPIPCNVTRVATSPFYYQCLHLFIDPDREYKNLNISFRNFGRRFSRICSMPHLSLLYGELTDEEKKRAEEKVRVLDETITSLNFTIDRIALYKCNDEDRTQHSWEKILELPLG